MLLEAGKYFNKEINVYLYEIQLSQLIEKLQVALLCINAYFRRTMWILWQQSFPNGKNEY